LVSEPFGHLAGEAVPSFRPWLTPRAIWKQGYPEVGELLSQNAPVMAQRQHHTVRQHLVVPRQKSPTAVMDTAKIRLQLPVPAARRSRPVAAKGVLISLSSPT